jgi:hypothetical protein
MPNSDAIWSLRTFFSFGTAYPQDVRQNNGVWLSRKNPMIAVLILPLILAFAPAGVWALRGGGLRRLWLRCTLTLLSIVVLAVGLSVRYSVPSTARVAVYLLVFCGPSILLATSVLSLSRTFTRAPLGQLAAAAVGSIGGLALGFIIVVYGLRIW